MRSFLLQDAEGGFGVRGRLIAIEVCADGLGGLCVDDCGEGVDGGLLDAADRAEMGNEAFAGGVADAGDAEEFGVAVAHFAALSVVGDGEAVGFVADALNEVEDGRAAVEHDRVVFLAVNVDDLFFFGDGGERLEGDADLSEGIRRAGELA